VHARDAKSANRALDHIGLSSYAATNPCPGAEKFYESEKILRRDSVNAHSAVAMTLHFP
jgi:hypothetical protein